MVESGLSTALVDATRDRIADEMVTKRCLRSGRIAAVGDGKLAMRLTIRIGTIAAVCVAALAAIIKL